MVPEEHQSDLVDAGLRFLQVLNTIYGSEKSMEMWTTISDTVDEDLKGLIFSAMLSGKSAGPITIKDAHSTIDRILLVKTIRTWDKRVLSLGDSKAMMEKLLDRGEAIKVEVSYHRNREAREAFNNIGCILS